MFSTQHWEAVYVHATAACVHCFWSLVDGLNASKPCVATFQDAVSTAERRHEVVVPPLAEKVKLKSGTVAKVDVWGLRQTEVDAAVEDIRGSVARWQHRCKPYMLCCLRAYLAAVIRLQI